MHWVTQWNQRCIKAIIWSKPKHQNKWLKAAPTFRNSFRNTSRHASRPWAPKPSAWRKNNPNLCAVQQNKRIQLLKADKNCFTLIVPRLITDELMSNISKLKNKLWDFCLGETFCVFVFCLFAEIVQTTTNSNMFLKKNNWNIFQPERLPDLKNKILWGVWLTAPSEKCSIVLKKNLWVDEQDGGGFDPFINLARNKTSFSLRLTCRTRRQRLRMEGEEGEAGRGGEARLHCPAEEELGLLPVPWPASPWNSKNILRAERRDASLFISPSFSTLLFLPSSFQREAFHLYLLTSLSVVRL